MFFAFSELADNAVILQFIAGGAVVVGIVLEAAELIVKSGRKKKYRIWVGEVFRKERRRRLVLWVKYIKPRILPFELLGFSLIVAGLAVEWIAGTTAEVMQSSENRELESTNMRLSLRVEELRKQNDKMELLSKPRVGRWDWESMGKYLNMKPKWKAEVLYKKDDAESFEFARFITILLSSAGWEISGFREFSENDFPPTSFMSPSSHDWQNNDNPYKNWPLERRFGIGSGSICLIQKNEPPPDPRNNGKKIWDVISNNPAEELWLASIIGKPLKSVTPSA